MRRVNEAVREVVSEGVGELNDPRIRLVTVTGVETTPDLRQAVVFVSVLASEKRAREAVEALEAAHGVLQARVARELRMKRTPQLTFQYDPTVERGVRMTKLIDELAGDDLGS
jgi:ribosome-binding factor A